MEDFECSEPLPAPARPGGWRRALAARLPILQWAPQYSREAALADLVAGITLGLTLVPQSIAYAALADLPVQYGLYSAYIGTMLYVALGSVKEVSIGPTSLMALLTLQLCRGLPLQFMLLLTFLSGCVVLLMGLLRLGFLTELISPAVTSGFTSGTAVIIVVSQLKGLLGLRFTAESVADNLRLIAARWRLVRAPDAGLAAACCVALLLLRKLKDLPVSPKRPRLRRALWLVSIARNALVVLVSSTAAFLLHDEDKPPLFKLSGRVEAGLPRVSLPPFSAVVDNSTVGFVDMVQHFGTGLVMMPVVMVIANIAIAKAFSGGGRVDATQEMLTLGLCNIAGSFVHAMPTCGAFTRSAVSHSSGVRSPAAGLYSGIITLLALIFLTKYFYFIPKATLSSVLICAVIFMIDFGMVSRLWRADRVELGVLLVTFGTSVARSVEAAVGAGAACALAALLRRVMRARAAARRVRGRRVLRPELGLCYLNAERLARRAAALLAAARDPLLLDCSRLAFVDFSATQTLERLIKKAKEEQQTLVFFHASPDVAERLRAVAGLDARALAATAPGAALRAVRHKGEDEEGALLDADGKPGQV